MRSRGPTRLESPSLRSTKHRRRNCTNNSRKLASSPNQSRLLLLMTVTTPIPTPLKRRMRDPLPLSKPRLHPNPHGPASAVRQPKTAEKKRPRLLRSLHPRKLRSLSLLPTARLLRDPPNHQKRSGRSAAQSLSVTRTLKLQHRRSLGVPRSRQRVKRRRRRRRGKEGSARARLSLRRTKCAAISVWEVLWYLL